MECSSQAYWHSEYIEYQRCIKKSPSNMSYKRFAKRQFHKARRRNDKSIIEEQIDDLVDEQNLLNDIFKTNINRFNYLNI